tara:strand:+ start:269 stop:484 length:216 start_codon:yes stop_codon:yes gene_type:complete
MSVGEHRGRERFTLTRSFELGTDAPVRVSLADSDESATMVAHTSFCRQFERHLAIMVSTAAANTLCGSGRV